MSKKRQKKTSQARPPQVKKAARFEEPGSSNHLCPAWKIESFDLDGPWGRKKVKDEHVWEHIFSKLKSYETMTWGEIEKARKYNHSVSTDKFIKEARERLVELKLDDVDELFRLRLSGLQRVWGIRSRSIFRIIWWDPEHQICPSALKNTHRAPYTSPSSRLLSSGGVRVRAGTASNAFILRGRDVDDSHRVFSR